MTVSNDEITLTVRRRAQVSRLAKGNHSIEVTVEMTGPHTIAELVADVAVTYAQVNALYPMTVETK